MNKRDITGYENLECKTKIDMEEDDLPTADQATTCVILCHALSNLYQPLYLFRYDDKTGEVFILAGLNENIEIRVFRNGQWRFTNDEAEL